MPIQKISPFNGTIEVDSDKSITHRAIILGAAASGKTRVFNASSCCDCISTLNAVQNLGTKISKNRDVLEIFGGIKSGEFFIDAENSGTTARLLMGLLASKKGLTAHLTGDNSLKKRPFGRIITPLKLMGAQIEPAKNNNNLDNLSKNNNNLDNLLEINNLDNLPIKIFGQNLAGIDYQLKTSSAQLKSAILLAGLSASGETILSGETASRNHSELMLAAMGANLTNQKDKIILQPSQLNGTDFNIGGDFSSALYFLVLALASSDSSITIKNVGVNPTRTFALNFLKNYGAQIQLSNVTSDIEKTADITAISSQLTPFKITSETSKLMIDELPLLAVLACFIDGDSTISGASELRLKESDRIAAIADGLTKMGAQISTQEDGMVIHGKGSLEGGADVESYGDHRIEMSLVIASALSKNGGTVNGGYAKISFPNFYNILNSLYK